MPDKFFTQNNCDRCGGSLKDGRMMSAFNTDCLCMTCHGLERELPEFRAAKEAEHKEIRKGNYNFEGIGYPANKL